MSIADQPIDKNSREWLMECLARQILKWPKHYQSRFLHVWEFGRKASDTKPSLRAKGKAAGDELRLYVSTQRDKQQQAMIEARETMMRELELD